MYSLSDYVEVKPLVYQKLRVKDGGNSFGRKIMSLTCPWDRQLICAWTYGC